MSQLDFDALWDYEHPDQTEAVFRQLLPLTEQNNDLSSSLQLLTQIARTQGLQRQFDDAHKTLDKVEEQLSTELRVPTIRYLLERGRVLNSSGYPLEARTWFQQAWTLASEHGQDFYAIDALHMLAIIAPAHEQNNWHTLALQRAEASTDEHARNWRGSLYNNMGWTYHDLAEYEQALDLFQKGVLFRQEQGAIRETRRARWCVGRALRSLQRYQEALTLQMQLYQEWADSGEENDGFVAEEIGECLLILGRKTESRPYFAQAYSLLSQDHWLLVQEDKRLHRLKQLGEDLE